jgi:hypothetical protein
VARTLFAFAILIFLPLHTFADDSIHAAVKIYRGINAAASNDFGKAVEEFTEAI